MVLAGVSKTPRFAALVANPRSEHFEAQQPRPLVTPFDVLARRDEGTSFDYWRDHNETDDRSCIVSLGACHGISRRRNIYNQTRIALAGTKYAMSTPV
jgi:hypothetical protein